MSFSTPQYDTLYGYAYDGSSLLEHVQTGLAFCSRTRLTENKRHQVQSVVQLPLLGRKQKSAVSCAFLLFLHPLNKFFLKKLGSNWFNLGSLGQSNKYQHLSVLLATFNKLRKLHFGQKLVKKTLIFNLGTFMRHSETLCQCKIVLFGYLKCFYAFLLQSEQLRHLLG